MIKAKVISTRNVIINDRKFTPPVSLAKELNVDQTLNAIVNGMEYLERKYQYSFSSGLIFGSALTATFKPSTSDLDIMVFLDKPKGIDIDDFGGFECSHLLSFDNLPTTSVHFLILDTTRVLALLKNIINNITFPGAFFDTPSQIKEFRFNDYRYRLKGYEIAFLETHILNALTKGQFFYNGLGPDIMDEFHAVERQWKIFLDMMQSQFNIPYKPIRLEDFSPIRRYCAADLY